MLSRLFNCQRNSGETSRLKCDVETIECFQIKKQPQKKKQQQNFINTFNNLFCVILFSNAKFCSGMRWKCGGHGLLCDDIPLLYLPQAMTRGLLST